MIVRLRPNYDSVDFIDGLLYTYFIKTIGNQTGLSSCISVFLLATNGLFTPYLGVFCIPSKTFGGSSILSSPVGKKLSRSLMYAGLESFLLF